SAAAPGCGCPGGSADALVGGWPGGSAEAPGVAGAAALGGGARSLGGFAPCGVAVDAAPGVAGWAAEGDVTESATSAARISAARSARTGRLGLFRCRDRGGLRRFGCRAAEPGAAKTRLHEGLHLVAVRS